MAKYKEIEMEEEDDMETGLIGLAAGLASAIGIVIGLIAIEHKRNK